jgi:23S rRNA (guanine745-N1)-methyltransferase
VTLLCPVRTCHLALARDGRRLVCAGGHSFDVARSGYVNLLQPQDKRSRQPGDTTAAVAGRRRLHDSGATAPLLEAIVSLLRLTGSDTVLDAGCGEGFYPGNLAERSGCAVCGVDISVAAIESAARRYPSCEWIVANADRFVPYADASFTVVQSITARMNTAEFRRVLREDGRLLVALPGPADLIELRGEGRDRVARTVESFATDFRLIDQRRVTTAVALNALMVQDVLHSIYRPGGSHKAEAQRVTFSLDLLLFRPHGRIPL